MIYNIDLRNIYNLILPHFRPLLTDKNPLILQRGGAGSGKTVFNILKHFIRILGNHKRRYKFYVVMKTEASLQNTTYAEFEKWIYNLGLNKLCEIYKSPKYIQFFNGSKIIFIGCDQPDKLLGLSGADGIWVDEASRITLNDFEYINTRLRGVVGTYGQMILSFNPISKLNWIYKHFYLEPKDNITYHHSVVRDNIFLKKLDPGYLKRIEDYEHTNLNKYRTFWLGEWGSLEGVIYDNFDFVDETPENPNDIVYGLDFGTNVPSALVKIYEKEDEYWLEEKLYRKELITADIIRELNRIVPEKERANTIIYCDSAEPDRIEEIYRAGYNARKSIKDVNAGIDFVKEQKLHITNDSVNLKKEIESYCWEVDKNGEPTERPMKVMDHCFVGDTLIDTINGKVKIKDIRIGDLVLTRYGYRKVLNSWCTGIKKIYKYNINNNILECTPNHNVITDKGKVPISELTNEHTLYVKEDIICQKKLNLMELSIEDIPKQKKEAIEFITSIHLQRGQDIYTEINGNIITVQFLKEVISITGMEIHSTIDWIILYVLMEGYIYQNIAKNTIKIMLIKLENILKKLEFLQKNGINLKKEESGIRSMQKKVFLKEVELLKHVSYAIQNIKHLEMDGIDFVQTNVNQLIEEKKDMITKKEYALNANSLLQLINILKQFAVQNNVLHNTDGIRKKVYNLTIEGHHEYFANNILVANCMDAIRYTLYTHFGKKRNYHLIV